MVATTMPLSKDQLLDYIRSVILNKQLEKDPFYVLDIGAVDSLLNTWTNHLPSVQPFYAVKCNPNPSLLKRMAARGAGFECASRAEIETVLSLGISPDRIIIGNTCKPESHIKYAAKVGVNLATLDSVCELEKMKELHPECELLLRIKVPETSGATFKLGFKFGALPEEIAPLLQTARSMGLKIVGVSFHIGSRAVNFHAFEEAISVAESVFRTAAQLGLPAMRILDIGGGFPPGPRFVEAASAVRDALDKHCFVDEVKIVAEPGRYLASMPFTLVTNVTGKRVRGGVREYWINDGMYGSMNLWKYDHDDVACTPLTADGGKCSTSRGTKTFGSTVFGPTCDAGDTVLRDYRLPELEVGDWLVFHDMGAYTSSIGTDFNGFKTSAIPTYVA